MPNSLTDHAGDDLLERYSAQSLPESELAFVEEHLLVCEECRVRLRRIDRFTKRLRSALRQIESVPIDLTHDTTDGPIRLHVIQSGDGSFRATIAGQQLEGARRFDSVAEANEAVLEMFRKLFPGHECDERCGCVWRQLELPADDN